MKKALLLAAGAGVMCITSVQAQTQKGNGILSGGLSVGFEQQKRSSNLTNTNYPLSLNVSAGQFVADNWMLGAAVNYTGQFGLADYNGQQANTSTSSRNDFTLTPFFRRYWSVGPALVFAGAGLSAQIQRTATRGKFNDQITFKNIENSFSINPEFIVGGAYPISKRLALEGTIRSAILPIGASSVGLGLVYWTGATGTGAQNPTTSLTTTRQGNWVVEGGFGVSGSNSNIEASQESASGRSNGFNINVSIGNFIATNTLLGIGLGFLSSSSVNRMNSTSTDGKETAFSVSPYVQRYFGLQRLRPYVRGAVTISSVRQNDNDPVTPVQISIGPGLAYLINDRFIVETSLGNLSYSFVDNGENDKSSAVNLSARLGSGLSLRYVIAGAQK